MADKKDSDKKAKKARSLTSEEAKKPQPVAKPVDTRQVTVEVWGRGSSNPLMRAFINEHKTKRTVKRTAAQWIDLFREWKAKPRG